MSAQLIQVGQLAIEMNTAWLARNAARKQLQALLKKYLRETGEWFDPLFTEEEDLEYPVIIAAIAARKAAQKALFASRGRLRTAIRKDQS